MSQHPTLIGVTLETLENYRVAATRAVAAYRHGGHRLVQAVDSAFKTAVRPRLATLAPRAVPPVNRVRDSLTVLANKGIDQVATRTDQAIDQGSAKTAAQISKVAEFAAGLHNPMVASGLDTMARLSLPGAKAALRVSGKVADGADALVRAAGGRPAAKKAVRKSAATAKRRVLAVKAKPKAVAKPTAVKKAAPRAAKRVVAKAGRANRAAAAA
jgi:hypothetical protein